MTQFNYKMRRKSFQKKIKKNEEEIGVQVVFPPPPRKKFGRNCQKVSVN